MAARIAMGVIVIAALAWIALGLRNARLEADAAGGQLAEAGDIYLRAAELTPDTGPEVRAAAAANFAGDRREALRLLRDVVRREPENFDAWIIMIGVAADLDPELAARARERVRSLNPLQFR